jgi:radical SAM superfamily enzyme YgiQ (UPF0313 family)
MTSSRNILLVNPWIYDFAAYDFWLKPLGLLTVASILEETGRFRISLVDCLDRTHPGIRRPVKRREDGRGPYPKEEVPKPELLRDVPRRFSRYGIPVEAFEADLESVPRPDAVLVTCTMTYWYPGVQAAVDIIRKRFGSVPVILGGVYATLCSAHARSESGADVVVSGPGEETIFGVLREILGDGLPEDPVGRPPFSSLPVPAFDLLRDRRWLPLMTSRGCPHRCTFCASRLLSPGFEQTPPDSVVSRISGLFGRFGTRHFSFYDDALLVGKERHIVPILEGVAELGLPLSFHTPNGLHVREIDGPLAGLFRRAGVKSLYLSLESADTEWVKKKTAKVAAEDFTRAVKALASAGFSPSDVNVYVIAGLAGQDFGGVAESVRVVRRHGAVPRMAYFSPIPGTEEWAILVAKGVITDGSDPLLHNKVAFAHLRGEYAPEEWAEFRELLAGPSPKLD